MPCALYTHTAAHSDIAHAQWPLVLSGYLVSSADLVPIL